MKIAGAEFGFERAVGLRNTGRKPTAPFRPLTMRGVTIRNRIMLAPMSHSYLDGAPTDAIGSISANMPWAARHGSEETAVDPCGRRTIDSRRHYMQNKCGVGVASPIFSRIWCGPGDAARSFGSRGSARSPYEVASLLVQMMRRAAWLHGEPFHRPPLPSTPDSQNQLPWIKKELKMRFEFGVTRR